MSRFTASDEHTSALKRLIPGGAYRLLDTFAVPIDPRLDVLAPGLSWRC